MSNDSDNARPARQPWADRWLLDVMRERGYTLADSVQPANSAWEALEAAGISPDEILQVVCDIAGARPADVTKLRPEDAEMLSVTLSQRYDVVAVKLDGRNLEVATANPLGSNLERDLAFASAKNVKVSIASPTAIRNARARIYRQAVAGSSRLAWVVPQTPLMPSAAPTRGIAVDTLDRIVTDAIDQRASDIHLEPQDGELLVRFRVDGVLHDVMRVPADVTPLLLSRLKVGAGLDIANRLRPQDGRAAMIFDGRPVDLRISTLPLGERLEKAVIRILDASSTKLDFQTLGFSDREQGQLAHILAASEGMVLVTGPTGSGKTTTLYSALLHMKSHETNIVTVEDPIEYRLEGINQVQVNEKARLTFASALRSILRQDPDVVLVGEVRDVETAGIAIRASMTGHMVLSTLHTIDAASAMGRLADMGVDMSALAGALRAVIAQRLVRRLCTECSVPMSASRIPSEIAWAFEKRDTSRLRGPVGCAACRGTGYRGRMVIAELLVVDSETQQLMSRSTHRLEFLQLARKSGMHTLWETGLDRVLDGLTSLEELVSNVTPPIPDGELPHEHADRSPKSAIDAGEWQTPPAVSSRSGSKAANALVPARSGPSRSVVRELVIPQHSVVTQGWSRLVVAPRGPTDGRPRVLLVYEDAARRRTLRKAIERAGCVALEVADGEAALSYACRLRPDAVITDVALQKLDGIGLLQALVAESVVEHVFVYTDQRDSALLDWARELGAADVMTVDDDIELLATRIRSKLGTGPVVRRVS